MSVLYCEVGLRHIGSNSPLFANEDRVEQEISGMYDYESNKPNAYINYYVYRGVGKGARARAGAGGVRGRGYNRWQSWHT